MQISVIIPTFRRPDKLASCLAALARQTLSARVFEVIVTFDGRDGPSSEQAARVWREHGGDLSQLTIIEGEKRGPSAARNRAIAVAAGEILVFFNDDVVPDPRCLARHLAAQNEQRSKDQPAIVVGDSPWKIQSPDSFFAQMLRETSMIFFHAIMRSSGEQRGGDHDWGYRHAWLLNLSAPARSVRSVGGLRTVHQTYGREDDELAFRLTRDLLMPVLWRPDAIVEHDHAITPREYLRREYELGFGALEFAKQAPACAVDMFGRDLTQPARLSEAAALAQTLRHSARAALAWFESLDSMPPVGDSDQIAVAYQQHLPLKRWVWNAALSHAAIGRECDPDVTIAALESDAAQIAA